MANRLPLAAGTLRHLITIEEPYVSATGRANEQITSWRTWKTAYAAVKNAPGREFYQQAGTAASAAGQTRSEQLLRFTCRYAEMVGLTTAMRIVFNGNTFNIADIRQDFEGMVETVIEARLTQ